MGQRLNLEIEHYGTTLANCYYHWSGFTRSAADLAIQALEALPEKWDFSYPTLQAVDMLAETGASLDGESRPVVEHIIRRINETPGRKPVSFKALRDGVDRNEGLISVTSFGIYETRSWEEARVVIDTTNNVVRFGAVWIWDDIKDDFDDDDGRIVDDLNLGVNNLDIPFDKMPAFLDRLNELVAHGQYGFTVGGKRYEMIV